LAELDSALVDFLIRAKKATYASGSGNQANPSRLASHDLPYQEDGYAYLDTYLGGDAFIGEEAVWKDGVPVWGMNYYGTMTVATIPPGFSEFLKLALQQVPLAAPYRGPEELADGPFTYTCRWDGSLALFRGEETIAENGQVIYVLNFHGGIIR
jgi:hypothetical protein